MDVSNGIVVTAETLREWEERENRLAAEIAQRQKDLELIRQRRAAAAVLEAATSEQPENPAPAGSPAPDEDQGNMTQAIEIIVRRARAPLSRKELKKQLSEMGFPAERLENYFYTALSRLQKRNRIALTPDRRIWRIELQ